MTSPYTPVANAMTTITEPTDGEPRTVASVTQMTRKLADGIAYLNANTVSRVDVINASGTWTCPAGVTSVRIRGYGGGGGGAAGGTGSTTTDRGLTGGGGGGSSEVSEEIITVVPTTVYTTTIGAGGSGGAAVDAIGADGSPTSFGALAFFLGGQGGSAPQAISVTGGTQEPMCYGGNSHIPGAGQVPPNASLSPGPGLMSNRVVMKSACVGGFGVWSATATARAYLAIGGACPGGGYGGYGGTQGTDSATYRGGGAGGGGGGGHGVGANGALGGTGGNGVNPGTGGNGTAGANAAANTGGGGAGGGAGGHGTVAGGVRGAGGNGGSGRLFVSYVGAQAVIT